MSANEREKLWMAYLDGQMSAAEASSFDESLSPEERDRLAGEMRLEAGLAEKLRGGIVCPPAVWKHTQGLIVQRRPFLTRPLSPWWVAVTAVAAALVITLAQFVQFTEAEEPVLLLPKTVEELALASVTPADRFSVQAFLTAHGMQLQLADTGSGHTHEVEILGARDEGCRKQNVVEVLFTCCGKPAKVVLAQNDTRAADVLLQAEDSGKVQSLRVVGGFVAAVVSKHHTDDLLSLFSERKDTVV